MRSIQDCAVLHNGVKLPWLGFGVFRIPQDEDGVQMLQWAFDAGYRSVDTAMIYYNEETVGQAVKRSGILRQELFITTKVWNRDQGYESTLAAFDASLKRLQLDYLDLYLIHWPEKGKFHDTWRALEKLYRDGRVRAIGVCNFMVHHLEDLLQTAEIVPMVNQVEFHPRLQSPALVEYCKEKNIQLEAWAPLMKGQVMDIPELQQIGRKYGKAPTQVALNWMIARNVVTIPKSSKRERIFANADIFDFELTVDELALIDGLDQNLRIGEDPDDYDFGDR